MDWYDKHNYELPDVYVMWRDSNGSEHTEFDSSYMYRYRKQTRKAIISEDQQETDVFFCSREGWLPFEDALWLPSFKEVLEVAIEQRRGLFWIRIRGLRLEEHAPERLLVRVCRRVVLQQRGEVCLCRHRGRRGCGVRHAAAKERAERCARVGLRWGCGRGRELRGVSGEWVSGERGRCRRRRRVLIHRHRYAELRRGGVSACAGEVRRGKARRDAVRLETQVCTLPNLLDHGLRTRGQIARGD